MRSVHETGRAALQEVRSLLRVLREGDETIEPSEMSLDRVAELIDRIRATGLDVEFERSGTSLEGTASAAAYRVVQEALTNVVRHAGHVHVRVRMETTHDSLTVSVENDGPSARLADGGHGILGMRERVEALDGTLHAGPRVEGGFVVRAQIPLRVA